MKGSIIKRGKGVYQLRLSLGHDETTGKRIYKHRTVHCTLKEAQRHAPAVPALRFAAYDGNPAAAS